MYCPDCGEELIYWDSYHQYGKKLGEIYKCPNGAEENDNCESSCFRVAGCWYTDENGYLRAGYPC